MIGCVLGAPSQSFPAAGLFTQAIPRATDDYQGARRTVCHCSRRVAVGVAQTVEMLRTSPVWGAWII